MKILVFSDTHFGRKTDKRLKLLMELIPQYDKVIINGDFWDRYLVSWNRFLVSGWSKLFPLLKSKNTIYLLGNHDLSIDIDDRYLQFADECLSSYQIKSGSHTIHIEHGNRLYPTIDKTMPSVVKHKKLLHLECKIYDILASSGIYNYHKLGLIQNNKIIKRYRNEGGKGILITGHTHASEANKDERYYNSGLIRYKRFEYIEIIDGKINLVQKTI